MTAQPLLSLRSIVSQRNVPNPIIELLHKHVNAALTVPDVQKILDRLGMDTSIMTREEFAAFIATDAERWKNLVRDAHLSL